VGRLIDTSIFIESERGRLELEPHIAAHGDDGLFMSVITASELLHGVHRARAEFKSRRTATVEGWIAQFAVLDIDLATAHTYAGILAQLQAAGQLIGPHDLWLAATCLTQGLTMITANVREFGRVSGLEIEDWSKTS